MPMGRPSLISERLIVKAVNAVSRGASYEIAAAKMKISTKTFYNWMHRGAKETDTIYADFFQRVKEAEADDALTDLDTIRNAKVWQAAAWRLERRHGYVRREVTETVTTETGPDPSTPEGRAALLEQIKATPISALEHIDPARLEAALKRIRERGEEE